MVWTARHGRSVGVVSVLVLIALAFSSCSLRPARSTTGTAGTAATAPGGRIARKVTATVDWGSAGRLDPVTPTDDLAALAAVASLPTTGSVEVLLGRYVAGETGPAPQPGRLAYAVVQDPSTCVHGGVVEAIASTTVRARAGSESFCIGVYDARTGEAIVGIFRP